MSQSRIDPIPAGACPRTHAPDQARAWLAALAVAGVIVAGLMVLMAIHGPAAAQEAQEAEEQTDRIAVPYTPRDLDDPARQRRLLARIDRAALKVCGDMDGVSIPTQEIVARSDCRRDTLARAVATLRNPALTRLAQNSDPRTDRQTGAP